MMADGLATDGGVDESTGSVPEVDEVSGSPGKAEMPWDITD